VLVADDNPLNRDLLQRFLGLQQHAVAVARDGREAVERLREEDFDLVLLDILMPEFTGLEVLDEMARMGKLKYTPVIVVSGLDSTAVIVECLQKGAEDFLTRPIDMDILQARVNACLEKKRLRERELQQFFPEAVARQFLSDPERLSEGRRADVTILFGDIQGFSAISEGLGPIETIRWLSGVMNFLSHCVLEHEGVLVDYIGDEILAMWGAPTAQPHHAELACRAAHAMLRGLPEVSRIWQSQVQSETTLGIGLNSGEAFVGNIGTARKFKYGPLGNTVNLASRVQGATRHFQSPLLLTGATRRQLGPQWLDRRLSQVRVRNIRNPIELYELAPPTQEEAAWRRLRDDYQHALEEYEGRNLRRAAAILGNLLLEFPGDGPSLLLMSRTVNALLQTHDRENGDDFDPVWTLPGK
jgi:adenylate cyclase